MTFWTGMAHARLGCAKHAKEIFQKIYDYSLELEQQVPKIDYFATSLPAMLLFENDLAAQNQVDESLARTSSPGPGSRGRSETGAWRSSRAG